MNVLCEEACMLFFCTSENRDLVFIVFSCLPHLECLLKGVVGPIEGSLFENRDLVFFFLLHACLQGQPWVGLEALLGPVPVVVEKLGARLDVHLGDKDEARHVFDHHHLGLAVGGLARVVDQAAQPAALCCRVDTAKA